jgi:hypothetical protein
MNNQAKTRCNESGEAFQPSSRWRHRCRRISTVGILLFPPKLANIKLFCYKIRTASLKRLILIALSKH